MSRGLWSSCWCLFSFFLFLLLIRTLFFMFGIFFYCCLFFLLCVCVEREKEKGASVMGLGFFSGAGKIRQKYISEEAEGELDQKKERRRAWRKSNFKFGGPSQSGDAFPLLEKGECFYVENGKRWFIYNDTLDREMHVTMRFDEEVDVFACDRTELSRKQCGWVAKIIVYPLETVLFVFFDARHVAYNDMETKSNPLTEAYLEKVNAEAVARLEQEKKELLGIASRCCTEEEILRNCRRTKSMYVDMSFFPGPQSLEGTKDVNTDINAAEITWKRATDYIPHDRHDKIQLFRGRIDPKDVDQGQLGNSWLMGALSALALCPSLVKGLFCSPIAPRKTRKEQKYGVYRVTLNKHGWWENVIVDSYLPTIGCQPVFGRCANDPCKLWVSLIEKAYAKVHGSYAAIKEGDSLSALRDLTGFPFVSFADTWIAAVATSEAASSFFKTLQLYREKGYLITLSTPAIGIDAYNNIYDTSGEADNGVKEHYRSLGLELGSLYSVVDVRRFSFPEVLLMKIRGLCGGCGLKWTGAWSEKSEKWNKHPLIRFSCQPAKNDDGTFWMEWSDVSRYFSSGGACMVRRRWFDYRIRGLFHGSKPNFFLKVVVKQSVNAYLTLSQRDKRGLKEEDPDAVYKGLLISVSRYHSGTDTHILHANSTLDPEAPSKETCNFYFTRDVSMRVKFLPEHSPYYIVPRVGENAEEAIKTFTLGFISKQKPGKDELQVNFMQLSSTEKSLENGMQDALKAAQPQSMWFQYKKHNRPAVVREGESIQDSKKVK
ncbi:calpain-like cysteine peptidase [Trypanosoma cruzi marinkellei]|uniref:Calpain-like cysteine peptidase n=1 Tax=Trypanosoma cruzi marinkellei TaxID=85056 RepID=K2PAG9_TRYCR|nr:calpain-like cysteine peptidase [Trypanosoma cruzi marinkellei]